MKIFKKINKGFILTIIVLLVLIMYLNGVEKQREVDKKVITEICENFVNLTNKYSVLPEEMQKLDTPINQEKEQEYIEQMKKELSKIMIDNKDAVELQHKYIKENLQNGYKNLREIRSNFKRDITKISAYEFYGNRVKVTFNSKVENSVKYLDENNEEQIRNNISNMQYDSIILQQVNGEWKIISSNLSFVNYNMFYEDSMKIY